MKKLLCAPLLALALISLLAQTAKAADGIMVWKAADLKAYAGRPAPRVAVAQKIATQTLANLDGNTRSWCIARPPERPSSTRTRRIS